MATKVVMEALSPTMEEGRLVEWKKQEGDPVAVGDVLAEVETDKAVMELVARAAGTLLKQVVPAGATVPVSDPVALIGEPGEAVDNGKPTPAQKQQATQPAPGQDRPVSMPPAPEPPAPEPPAARVPAAAAPASEGRVKASPLARRIAAERGIDLGALAGSGPEGRVVLRDLEQAPPAAPARAGGPPTPRPVHRKVEGAQFTDVPLNQL